MSSDVCGQAFVKKKKKSWIKSEISKIHSMTFPFKKDFRKCVFIK